MNPKLPSLYSPNAPEDFIGPAAQVARLLQRAVKDAFEAERAPLKVLFNGDPGIGKSALAKFLIGLLGADPKWSVKKYNGTRVKVETVDDIAADLHYRDMFGNYRVIWIEEADAIPALAQVTFLTLLDDLPNGCAVVATSNCKLDEFKKRFQTRFKLYEVEPPAPHEIEVLLRKFLTNPRDINNIATFACGCVRQALLDAETSLQAAA
jgi:replication-associated recombination protein RarA